MPNPAVVRVFATTQEPDYESPWQSLTSNSGTGSGVVVGPSKVLTGAHVVANATFIRVQKVDDPNKVVARVASVCHDCDLALLEIADDAFTADITPAEVGELPDLRDRVSVLGYPIGGEEISVTEGVVSRIEVQRYSHSQRYLLAVTIDAAINRGNSGGPVFKDGKIAGIAFQTLNNAENIGEMVPAPIIKRFIEGIESGRSLQLPAIGVRTQNLENPTLRRRLGIEDADGGVLIVSVDYGSSAYGVVEAGDALLSVGGHRIANNGTVRYLGRHRTHFDVLLGESYIGDELEAEIFRRGEKKQVKIPLRAMSSLVKRCQYDTEPTYFVYGGMVFQTLSLDFLATWNRWWERAPKEFLHYYFAGVAKEKRQEVVVLTQILADEINVGYDVLYNESVVSVNDVEPRNTRHFVELVEGAEGLVEIKTSRDNIIALDANEARAANERILKRYHIARDRSNDLAAAKSPEPDVKEGAA